MQTQTINDIIEFLQSNTPVDDNYKKKLCYQLIELAISEDDENSQAYGLYYLGNINYRQRRYKQSLDYLLKCRELIKEDTEPSFQIQVIILIGMIMTKLGYEQCSIDYFSEALQLTQINENYGQEALIYSGMASVYARFSAYQDALFYYDKEKQCYEQHRLMLPKQELIQRWCCLSFSCGLIYCAQEKYNQAFDIMRYVEQYKTSYDGKVELLYYIFKIRLYIGIHRIEECMTYIQMLFDKISELPDILDIYDEFLTLFDIFIEHGYASEAYHVIQIMEKTANSVHSDNCQLKYSELQAIYHQKYGSKDEFAKWFEKFLYYEKKDENEVAQIKLANLREKQLIYSTDNLKKLMEQDIDYLKKKSEHDALTGLANRYYLNDYFDVKCKEAVKKQITLGIDIIDIDCFKKYNDSYGHLEGDHCLTAVADAMKEAAEEHFLSRFGGDEFIIVFLGESTEKVEETARKIRDSVCKRKIIHAKEAVSEYVTISQGIVNEIPTQGHTITDFIHSADTALYHGKGKERNAICIGTL